MAECLILAIETSCDETAASVYSNARGVCSNSVCSQILLHQSYGGVVPEIASRSHLNTINTVVTQALEQAGVALQEIAAIGVVNKPGLPGSLLVGVCFAKAIASCLRKPLVAVDHVEGHIFSSFLEQQVPFPHVCLMASGGNTALYMVYDFGQYQMLGTTLDDAAGEAFDKVAKLIGLAYPGGPILEQLAAQVNFTDVLCYPRNKQKTLDFSFSGLKTAVLYDVVARGFYDLEARTFIRELSDNDKRQISSSLLNCIADVFVERLTRAYCVHRLIKAVTFVGGVASNYFLREQVRAWANLHGLPFFVPSRQYCTDNAAMAAFVANYRFTQGRLATQLLDIN